MLNWYIVVILQITFVGFLNVTILCLLYMCKFAIITVWHTQTSLITKSILMVMSNFFSKQFKTFQLGKMHKFFLLFHCYLERLNFVLSRATDVKWELDSHFERSLINCTTRIGQIESYELGGSCCSQHNTKTGRTNLNWRIEILNTIQHITRFRKVYSK